MDHIKLTCRVQEPEKDLKYSLYIDDVVRITFSIDVSVDAFKFRTLYAVHTRLSSELRVNAPPLFLTDAERSKILGLILLESQKELAIANLGATSLKLDLQILDNTFVVDANKKLVMNVTSIQSCKHVWAVYFDSYYICKACGTLSV